MKPSTAVKLEAAVQPPANAARPVKAPVEQRGHRALQLHPADAIITSAQCKPSASLRVKWLVAV